MKLPIYEIVFYIFAALLIVSAIMVVASRNPVRAALFLVLAFVASAVLWMLLQAEFLSLVLIFVYVGAVMTLFLFVVMMLNIDLSEIKEGFVRYLPFGLIVMLLFIAIMLMVLTSQHLPWMSAPFITRAADYNNTAEIGTLLFTKYVFALEVAALILFVAIVAAISLTFHGRKPDTRAQKVAEQVNVRKEDRLRIIKMEPEL